MASFDPIVIRRVLGATWVVANDGDDYAEGRTRDTRDPPANEPPAPGKAPTQPPPATAPQNTPTHRPDPAPAVLPPGPGPKDPSTPPQPVPGHVDPYHAAVVHPAHRTVTGTGPKIGFLGVISLALGVFFVALPTSALTSTLGGFFFFVAFGFFMALGCCCVPITYNTTVHNHGNTGNLPPVITPGPFAPIVRSPAYAPVCRA
jgi:hypothetical protein